MGITVVIISSTVIVVITMSTNIAVIVMVVDITWMIGGLSK